MAYTVDWIPSPNFTPGSQTRTYYGRPRTTEIIVQHWWGSPASNPTYQGVVAWFQNPASQVSAHYVVGQGKMCQMVDENDTAWHAMSANPFGIGIEFNPNPTDDDYDRVGWLVYNIRSRLGALPLKAHRDYVNTQCPGTTDLARIDRIAAAYATPAPVTPEWQKNLVNVEPQQLQVLVTQTDVIDLRNGAVIKPLAYGTLIDFVAKTTVGGVEYYISSYSMTHGLPNGIRKTDVGLAPVLVPPPPVTPPLPTIPEYEDNTVDTPDTTMWAKVDTSLINFSTGLPEKSYTRGTSFEIAAETEFAGKRYAITTYSFGKKIWKGLPLDDLSLDKPVDPAPETPVEPVDLVEQRLGFLEAAVQRILDFLSSLFTNFRR